MAIGRECINHLQAVVSSVASVVAADFMPNSVQVWWSSFLLTRKQRLSQTSSTKLLINGMN